MRPRAVFVPLLIALGANCREDTLPEVPRHPPSSYVEVRCTEIAADIADAPVRVEPIFVDGSGPRPTLPDMVEDADAIIVGSIVGERFKTASGTCMAQTLVTVAVDSVIKDHAGVTPLNGRLVVSRLGGKLRKGDIVVRQEEDGFPSFEVGGRYLLLLSWNEIQRQWYVGASYSTLKVEGTVLAPVADDAYGPLVESGRGKELNVFAAHLRTLAPRR